MQRAKGKMTESTACSRVRLQEGRKMQIFNRMNHLTDDALSLHAINDLPESSQPAVSAHLATCVRCRRQFREAQDFIAIFRLAATGQVAEGYYASA